MERKVKETVDAIQLRLVEFLESVSVRINELLNSSVEKALKVMSNKFDTLISSIEAKIATPLVVKDNPKLLSKLDEVS